MTIITLMTLEFRVRCDGDYCLDELVSVLSDKFMFNLICLVCFTKTPRHQEMSTCPSSQSICVQTVSPVTNWSKGNDDMRQDSVME